MTKRSKVYRNVRVAVMDEGWQFAELEEEWEELYRECPRATPFQSWAWLYSWWEHYAERRELRLVTVRSEEGLLVGLLPLMLEGRGSLGRLKFIGTGITDYLDALVRDGWEEEIGEAGLLGSVGSWGVADLQALRPDAVAWDILREWSGLRVTVWQENCPFVHVRPWDEVVTTLSRNLRSTVRRSIRRAESDGINRELVDIEQAEEAGRRLVAINRQLWQKRMHETGVEHWTQTFEEHIATAARRMTARGLGGISELWAGGKLTVSTFLIFGRDWVGGYMIGADPETPEKIYQWSSLYIWDGINIALGRNATCFDLLRGEELYKLRWSSGTTANHRLVLGRNPWLWVPYAAYFAARSRAKLYVNSDQAPEWTRKARKRYHVSRQGIRRGAARVRGLLNTRTIVMPFTHDRDLP